MNDFDSGQFPRAIAGERKPVINEEIRLIPLWSVALALIAFIGMQLFLYFVLMPREHHHRPLPFSIFWGLFAGTVLAFLMLMVGYVNQDARRRNMNVALWTLLVLFIPNGVGFIIYFLMRHPLMASCPQCSEKVHAGFNFCPRCHFQLSPTCPQCKRPVRAGDAYCAYCGSTVAPTA